MVAEEFLLPAPIWEHIQPLLPEKQKKSPRGRKPLNPYKVASGIYYVLRTGCQWKAVPNCFGSGSSIHKYFQEWNDYGVFQSFWQNGLLYYDEKVGIKWKWQSIDSSMVKSPLGGENTGKNPTDRAKLGTKRSIIVDGKGIPISLVVKGANVHDSKIVEENLDNIMVRKYHKSVYLDHFCADKGYDSFYVELLVISEGLNPMICRRKTKNRFTKKWKRWTVERSFSWFNKFRKILIRWEKRSENYEGLMNFVCGIITLRAILEF